MYEADARDQALARKLDADLEGSPVRGRPLPRRLRNFRPGVDAYVAGLHGPPAYIRRLAQIESLSAEHEGRLADARRRLADRHRDDPRLFALSWRRTVERWNFGDVNELIDRHNRFYRAEARLPMDPRTGDFVLVDGRSYRRRPLDASLALRRFPARLEGR